ncbi:MAG: hypothetical protein GY936_08555 [Ignavibacteriae bacterium]|nr:hypothetical protein [Ignavibacteriota bacterium]
MKLKIILFLGIITFLVWNCSSSKIEKVDDEIKVIPKIELIRDVNLNIEKTLSWVNLMPGSKPKFHISGNVNLLNGEGYNLENTKLKFVKVFQFGKEMYFVIPKVRVENKNDSVKIMFSTLRGLSVNKELNMNKNVMFEFIFNNGMDDFIYQINDVELQEVH